MQLERVGQLVSVFECYGDHRDLHSFPTRRSSDLCGRPPDRASAAPPGAPACPFRMRSGEPGGAADARSEEHTSELQSHSDLVCRLLLEKKNNGLRDVQESAAVDLAGPERVGHGRL